MSDTRQHQGGGAADSAAQRVDADIPETQGVSASGVKQIELLSRVSIIIVTYKGDDVLADCLDSLKTTCGEVPQIVVVDNSPSITTERLVKSFPNAVYVESPGNPGFAGGNNNAIPFCDREYVLLLNNDTVVHDASSITDLVRFLETNPKCGIVQGSIVLPNADGTAGGCGSYLTPLGFQYARGFAVPLATPGLNVPTRCFSVIGAFMMFPKKLLEETGGFLFYDHFKSYYEESDFCHRAWLAGKEVWYVPTEPISHLCGHTASMFSHVETMRRYIRNSFFSLKVNLSWWARLIIVSNYHIVMLVHAFMHLLRGDKNTYSADMGIFSEIRGLRKEIKTARRSINRRIGDVSFIQYAVRLPSLAYLVRSIRSNA